jgi:hypothetical protein
MALPDTIRNAVALANRLTADLQVTVRHEAVDTVDVHGDKTYHDPVDVEALVEWKQRSVVTPSGEVALSVAKLTFLRDIVITIEDRLTITGGAGITDDITAPILNIAGLVDSGTNRPYVTEVYIGAA